MKSIARVMVFVLGLAMALTIALAVPALAADGSLSLIKSTPESGGVNVPIENTGIKLFFNGNVTDPGVWAFNSKCFTLKDDTERIIDYNAYAGQRADEEGYILVIASPIPLQEGMPGQLTQDAEYTLTISADLMSIDGAKLGEDITIGFRTMDVAANSRLSMTIMIVMMIAVMGLMFVTNWRKMKAEAEAAALANANPYRIAKEKSISVDEAKTLIEKAKEKNQKMLEKTGGKAPEPVEKKSSAPRLDTKKKKKITHKVKGPRPVSEGGSKFKTGRKAEKERQRKAEAAKKAAKKAAQGQQKTGATGGSKGGKKGKGKKK